MSFKLSRVFSSCRIRYKILIVKCIGVQSFKLFELFFSFILCDFSKIYLSNTLRNHYI